MDVDSMGMIAGLSLPRPSLFDVPPTVVIQNCWSLTSWAIKLIITKDLSLEAHSHTHLSQQSTVLTVSSAKLRFIQVPSQMTEVAAL